MNAFIEHFHFLRPLWLLSVFALPFLLWVWHRRMQHADPWRRICDPQLLPHLSQSPGGRWRDRGASWLIGVGYVLVVLALAGPAFRMAPQTVVRLQSPLIIAVDLSDRMRATDLKPNRMARVRFKLADLLARRVEGQTALIGYAGDAFTVAPLTDDAASLADLAAALSPDVMPLQGQRADRAIDLALQLLQDAGHDRGDLLLLTDQVDTRAMGAAKRARAAGLQISVLGVGTAEGAPALQASGGFLPDAQGGILLPKLDRAGLEAIARAGDGRYATLGVDASDLRSLGVLDAHKGDGQFAEASDDGHLAWHDEGPWLLLLLLPMAALAFRRGWLASVLVVMLLPVQPAQAFGWPDLWQRSDQRAWQALQDGDPEQARVLARDPALAGAAAYRSGDYKDADELFAQGDDAQSHYNQGNALAKAGDYEKALGAYDTALTLQPDFPDASANRKAVEDWLQQQKQQQDQDQDQQGEQDQSQEGDGSGQSDSQSEGASGEQQESSASDEDGEASDDQASQDPSQQEQGEADDGAQHQEESQEGDPSADAESSDTQSDDAEQAQANPQQDDSSSSKGSDAKDADTPTPAPEDEAQNEEALDRYGQEMQDALEQGEPGEEGAAPVTLSTEEAEQQQAMEHLLRRVPDDPGGLLRRKFQLEFQRRQQQGGRR